MTKKMLIDAAHPEEVRVALLGQGNKIEDFDFESEAKKPLRGNIFLARVTRVEPSLQAAFVDYGGNRHGFLAFSEIHPDYYQIPVSDREKLQEAEKEVAALAAELELSQRGDEEDDEDGNDEPNAHDDRDDNEASASGDAEGAETADASVEDTGTEDSGDDASDEEVLKAADNDADGDEEASPKSDDGDDADEEEEEEDVKEEDDAAADSDGTEQKEATSGADDEQPWVDLDDNENGSDVKAEADDEDAAVEDDATEDNQEDGDDDGAEASEDGDEEPANKKTKKSAAAKARDERNALFERYKDAKRKRSSLLRNYKIQEVIKRRQILLIQVVKEERGNKGAALTTYMSLAGRYCVLMPNTARGGGISRKIAHISDRRRLKRVVDSLDVPQGMGLIIRTAGAKRTKTEIKRDYDYLLRLWENIRTLTLKSIAPCLVYEEASLIKRAIRDLYDKDISKVMVEGEAGYREAKDFMKMLMPSHAKNVQPYKDNAPIFLKYGVENQLDGMYQPSVRLKSGGYLVIHQTEALVAIDVNSGRSTRERNIEQTALKTNVEAAEEAARQFRLRDLAGLIVIDFIDMEEPRNNRKVEKALKDAMKNDRARVQLGRISSFGLLELSRQRRRSGIVDGTTQSCPTCAGAGVIRSHEIASLRILRAIEGEAISGKVGRILLRASTDVSLHILNHNRDWINRIEAANGVKIEILADPDKAGDAYDLEKSGTPSEVTGEQAFVRADLTAPSESEDEASDDDQETSSKARHEDSDEQPSGRKRRRRRRGRKDAQSDNRADHTQDDADGDEKSASENDEQKADGDKEDDGKRKRRRRGRRGGKRNRRNASEESQNAENAGEGQDAPAQAQPDEGAQPSEDSPKSNDETSVTEAAESSADTAPQNEGEEKPKAKRTRKRTKRKSAKDSEDSSASAPEAPSNTAAETKAEEPAEKAASASNGKSDAVKAEKEKPAAIEAEPTPKKPARKGWWQRATGA